MKIKLNIELVNSKYKIEYSNLSNKTTFIECTAKQLLRTYNITRPEQITFDIVTQMIVDNKLNIRHELVFNSVVTTKKSKNKEFKFQIENNIVLITNVSIGDEMFIPKNKIKSFFDFTKKDWDELYKKRETITPTTHNIQSNQETGLDTPVEDFFKDFNI